MAMPVHMRIRVPDLPVSLVAVAMLVPLNLRVPGLLVRFRMRRH